MSSDEPEDQHALNSRSEGEAVKASNPLGPSTEAEEVLLAGADLSTGQGGREACEMQGIQEEERAGSTYLLSGESDCRAGLHEEMGDAAIACEASASLDKHWRHEQRCKELEGVRQQIQAAAPTGSRKRQLSADQRRTAIRQRLAKRATVAAAKAGLGTSAGSGSTAAARDTE